MLVEDRDRLARFGVEQVGAALAARVRRIVVADRGDTAGDLLRDLTWVRQAGVPGGSGEAGALNRALCAVGPAENTGSESAA
jgi:putative resolvase